MRALPALTFGPLLQRLARRVGVAARCHWFAVGNVLDRRPVTGNAERPVVSLTTHATRARTVHYTIESIAHARVKPSRLILWVDEPDLALRPNAKLRRLQGRGLEIRLTENLGPHTKYFPYVMSATQAEIPLVTADDDIIYPRYWLAELLQAYTRHPQDIHCFRAHTFGVDDTSVQPYEEWKPCNTTEPSPLTFATGVSGVIYPPRMLQCIRQYGRAFVDKTLANDDIWLHWVALRAGIPVRQARTTSLHFGSLRSTQRVTLSETNVAQGRNDQLIRETYSAEDLRSLIACATSHTGLQ